MKKKYFTLLALASIIGSSTLSAQNINRVQEPQIANQKYRHNINIPNIDGYVTLKGDFHIHTVFSDGLVWPTVRVDEAWEEGLDVIAITDHIEYLPHKKYLDDDFNTPYNIAKPRADMHNILLVKAGEITRGMAPGHINALFLDDVNKLNQETPMEAIEAAIEQGAFIQWNHPGWAAQQPDTTKWWDFHTEIYEKGWLHGIEVFNSTEWYPIAIDWCRDKNLGFMANTDIHVVNSHKFNLESSDRPMTLIFAKDRTLESVKEAMFAKRCIARFADKLAGDQKLMEQLFHASVQIKAPYREVNGVAYFEICNSSDLPFTLELIDSTSTITKNITLYPQSSVNISCKSSESKVYKYRVTNCYTGSDSKLEVTLRR